MSVSLVVPRSLVKTVKTALESENAFGRQIAKVAADDGGGGGGGGGGGSNTNGEELFLVSTTIANTDAGTDILKTLHLDAYSSQITITTTAGNVLPPVAAHSPLESAITSFLSTLKLPPETVTALLSTSPRRWSLYPPLLLLPPTSFTSLQWTHLLSTLTPALKSTFYQQLTTALGATHLAINAPIPPSPLRKPTKLTPLYGDFGPVPSSPPTAHDFTTAFWCTTTQNGIYQTWPPLHCMFSRGNISEKSRIMTFPCVAGENIVDMYAGIGYFTLSYAKAGASRVWCWEINPWSVEALRRGAEANAFCVRVVEYGEVVTVDELDAGGVKVCVFAESNMSAAERMKEMGVRGVRHVNMGLLPDCMDAWGTAAELVDEGWVHVHANVEVGGEEKYAGGVMRKFENTYKKRVECEKVQVVKTFAPGVVHCVSDIRVRGG